MSLSLSLYSLFRAIQFHVIFFVCLHHTFHLRHKVVPFHNFFFLSSTYDTVSDYKRYQMLQNIPIKCYLYSLVLPTYIPTYSFFFLSSTYSIVYLRCLKICPSIFLSLLLYFYLLTDSTLFFLYVHCLLISVSLSICLFLYLPPPTHPSVPSKAASNTCPSLADAI